MSCSCSKTIICFCQLAFCLSGLYTVYCHKVLSTCERNVLNDAAPNYQNVKRMSWEHFKTPKCQQNLKLQLLQLHKFLRMFWKSGTAAFKTLFASVGRTLERQNVNKPLRQKTNWQRPKMVLEQLWLRISNWHS